MNVYDVTDVRPWNRLQKPAVSNGKLWHMLVNQIEICKPSASQWNHSRQLDQQKKKVQIVVGKVAL